MMTDEQYLNATCGAPGVAHQHRRCDSVRDDRASLPSGAAEGGPRGANARERDAACRHVAVQRGRACRRGPSGRRDCCALQRRARAGIDCSRSAAHVRRRLTQRSQPHCEPGTFALVIDCNTTDYPILYWCVERVEAPGKKTARRTASGLSVARQRSALFARQPTVRAPLRCSTARVAISTSCRCARATR